MDLSLYTASLFQDREAAIEEIQSLARVICDGRSLSSRTIVYRGGRGFGKSWLAIHVKREILPELPDVLPIFLGFGEHYGRIFQAWKGQEQEWYAGPGVAADEQLRDLVIWMAREFDVPRARDLSTRDIAGYLLRTLRWTPISHKGKRYQVLALVLDAIFDAPEPLLNELENVLLGGLANLPHVLIVMTGREKSHLWEAPSLALPAAATTLPEFDEQELIAEQLRRQLPGLPLDAAQVEAIKAIGKGYPLNNYLVARALADPSTWDAAVIELVGSKEMLAPLYGLCVLEGFRDEQILPMVRQYEHAQKHKTVLPLDATAELRAARELNEELVRRRLVRWDWQEGQYMIAPSIQPVLAYDLHTRQPEVAMILHRQAQQLYSTMDAAYASDHYREQAARHAQRADELAQHMTGGRA